MAQKTFVDGDVLTASDINTYLTGEGGAWTAFTPQVDQGASTNIAKTISYSNYARSGRMITWTFALVMTAGGTAGTAVTVALPVAATTAPGAHGAGLIFDNSTTTNYAGSWVGTSTTAIIFSGDWSTAGASWGASPNLAIATSDQLRGTIIYEAAS